jgi:anion-transporting  ArsA/GET3 family ATPase
VRINSLKTADKEVLAIRKVMETPNQTPQQLVAALKKKAPKLSEFAKTAFGKASAEYHAGASKLDKSAQAGLKMVGFFKKKALKFDFLMF